MPRHARRKRAKQHLQPTSPKTVPSKPSPSKFEKGIQILLAGLKIGSLLIWVMGKDGPIAEKLITVIHHILKGKEE